MKIHFSKPFVQAFAVLMTGGLAIPFVKQVKAVDIDTQTGITNSNDTGTGKLIEVTEISKPVIYVEPVKKNPEPVKPVREALKPGEKPKGDIQHYVAPVKPNILKPLLMVAGGYIVYKLIK